MFAAAGTVAYVRRRAIAAYIASSGPGPFEQPLTREQYERGVVILAIVFGAVALAFLLGWFT